MVYEEIIPKGGEGREGELGRDRFEWKADSYELKAAARRMLYRRDPEYAEKGNGERFNTECTEERRRAQRKKERSFTRYRGFRMTMLVASSKARSGRKKKLRRAGGLLWIVPSRDVMVFSASRC
jgi:hypothetical protein